MKTEFKFKVGQRVAERPRIKQNLCSTPEAHELYNKCSEQRYGVVVGLLTKKNSRGQNRKFVQVKWDNRMQPSEHEQMRICAVASLNDEVKSLFLGHD